MTKTVKLGPFVIYALVDSADPIEIRYIGQTANPKARFSVHLRGKSHSAKIRRWVRGVFEAGNRVQVVVLETVATQDLADEYERKWIYFARSNHNRVINTMSGRVDRQMLPKCSNYYHIRQILPNSANTAIS